MTVRRTALTALIIFLLASAADRPPGQSTEAAREQVPSATPDRAAASVNWPPPLPRQWDTFHDVVYLNLIAPLSGGSEFWVCRGGTFVVEGRLDNPNGRAVDAVDLNVDYNTTFLAVSSQIADGDGRFPTVLTKTADGLGHVDLAYGRAIGTTPWSANALIASLTVTASTNVIGTVATAMTFSSTWPRITAASGGGSLVPHIPTGLNVFIENCSGD